MDIPEPSPADTMIALFPEGLSGTIHTEITWLLLGWIGLLIAAALLRWDCDPA